METYEFVIEMKLLERRLTLYEEKYGVLSEDFYGALMAGKLAEYDAFDETRADFSRWKGIYETWRRRKEAYRKQILERGFANFCVSNRPTDAHQSTALLAELQPVSCQTAGSARNPDLYGYRMVG